MTPQSAMLQRSLMRTGIVFLLLASLLKLAFMPHEGVHVDTNYYLNIGSNYIERGEVTPYMWRLDPDTNIIAGSGSGYGIYFLTIWLKATGLSLYSGYALMYSLGLLTLFALYFLARDWWQGMAGGFGASVFVALSGLFMAQFYVRMDAPALLVYTLILYLHWHALRRQRNSLHAMVGIALIAAAEVHILALLYIGGISLYYFVEHVQVMRTQRSLWMITPSIYYFGGLLFAGFIYIGVHILPDPEAYFHISRECLGCGTSGLFKEFQRYILIFFVKRFEIVLVVAAITAAAIRATQADRHFLIIVLGYVIAQGIIGPPIVELYMSHMLPLMGLGVGGLFMKGFKPDGVFTQNHLLIGLGVALVLFQIQVDDLYKQMYGESDPLPNVEYILQHVPDDVVVMSTPELYYLFIEYDQFLSYDVGTRHSIQLRNEDYATFWEREAPQVYVGEPLPDDDEFWAYMVRHDFHPVRESIWIADDLLSTIVGDTPSPEVTYSVSDVTIDRGACVSLEWSVTGADRVMLNENPVSASGISEVCPRTSRDYWLRVFWLGEMQEKQITITVE